MNIIDEIHILEKNKDKTLTISLKQYQALLDYLDIKELKKYHGKTIKIKDNVQRNSR
jgi:hypothetical protein